MSEFEYGAGALPGCGCQPDGTCGCDEADDGDVQELAHSLLFRRAGGSFMLRLEVGRRVLARLRGAVAGDGRGRAVAATDAPECPPAAPHFGTPPGPASLTDAECEIPTSGGALPWVSVTHDLPARGRIVLAHYHNRLGFGRVVRAEWIPRFSRESTDDCDDDFSPEEYCEAEDAYYWLEGWYETPDLHEEAVRIPHAVTHWMPLPAPPPEVPHG